MIVAARRFDDPLPHTSVPTDKIPQTMHGAEIGRLLIKSVNQVHTLNILVMIQKIKTI